MHPWQFMCTLRTYVCETKELIKLNTKRKQRSQDKERILAKKKQRKRGPQSLRTRTHLLTFSTVLSFSVSYFLHSPQCFLSYLLNPLVKAVQQINHIGWKPNTAELNHGYTHTQREIRWFDKAQRLDTLTAIVPCASSIYFAHALYIFLPAQQLHHFLVVGAWFSCWRYYCYEVGNFIL